MSTRKELELRVQELLEAETRYIARVRELTILLANVASMCCAECDHPDLAWLLGRYLARNGIYAGMPVSGDPEPKDQRSTQVSQLHQE